MKHRPHVRSGIATRSPSHEGEAMTREEALAMYHPIRASVRRILSAAFRVCNQADLMRAAKQLGLWADGKIVLPEDDEAAEMLADVALFEPNQRGRRAFDVFLAARHVQAAVEAVQLVAARQTLGSEGDDALERLMAAAGEGDE